MACPYKASTGDAFCCLVEGKVGSGLILAHEALQNPGVGLFEVHENECVHYRAEAGIHVEAENSSTQFQIMLQKGGNPRAVRFNVGDYCGELLQVVSDQFDGLPGEVTFPRGAKRSSGFDHP